MTTRNILREKLMILPFAQLYLSLSILFGTWVIYIPDIIEKLNMSEGQLGIALFIAAIGSIISVPFAKRTVNKYGEGRASFFIILILCFCVIGFFAAPDYYWLCVALFSFGITTGFLQVGINSLVATVEREKKVSIMSTCHGFFSLGAMISSGFGTILLIALDNPLQHVIFSAAVVFILQISYGKKYYKIKNQSKKDESVNKTKSIKHKGLWGLAVIAMIVMVAEGAIADWGGLYLKDVALTKKELLGLGYAGFSLSMTIGRLSGDYFSNRFGAWQIILGGYLISIVGFSIILVGHPLVSIIGFFVVGLGFSIVIPETYRLSANVKGVDPASGIALLAGVCAAGFLVGPVALGAVAEYFNLTISFIVLLIVIITGTLITISMRNHSKLVPSLSKVK